MKKSPRAFDDSGRTSASLRDEDDDTAQFAGAVGFFDASEASTVDRRRDSFDFGTMGFFECLDNKAEKALGVSQTTFSHDGGASGASMEWSDLAAELGKNPALVKLSVRNNKLLSADMQVLAGTLMKFHQLQVIDFSGNPLGIRGLATLLDCCRGNMELSELHVADIGIGDVAEHEFEIVSRTLDDFPSLRVLNLSGNNLSIDLMRTLALSVNEHPRLNRLYLERNNVSAANVADILRFLPGNVQLHTLYASNQRGKGRSTTVMGNPLRLLKRGFRGGGSKLALVEAITHNMALRNVQIDGLSAQEQSRVSAVLAQNEQLWAMRNADGGGMRLLMASRGIGYMPDILFGLTLLGELDFSNNNLEAVPMQILSLKNLQWLSLEKNDIPSAALPVHLVELKKLRYLNLLGNPCAADLPKDCPADNYSALSSVFRTLYDREDMFEGQAAVVFVGAVAGEGGKLAAEVERLNKKSKVGLLRLVRSAVPTSMKQAMQGRLLPGAEVAAHANASKRTGRAGRMSFRAGSSLDLNAGQSCLWGVVHECEVAQFAVYALFHRVIVFAADLNAPDWESRARDVLSVLTQFAKLPNVILVLSGGNAANVAGEAKRALMASVLLRFKRFGVQDVLVLGSEVDSAQLHDLVTNAVLTEIDTAVLVPRSQVSFVASLMRRGVVATPSVPLSAFSTPNQLKALCWAQGTGLFSVPLVGGMVCSCLDWALSCLDMVTETEASVFRKDDLRVVFPSDAFSETSRLVALRVLETANAIVHTGWLHDQWIVQNQLQQVAPISAKVVHTLAQVPPGAALVTRLFRIMSPIVEVSVSSVIRKVFLQTAGVLSDITSVSATGFSGSLVLKDVVYVVRVSIEHSTGLTVVVDLHTDPSGQVVHMVTTAIERGLDEEQHKYVRLYLNEYRKETDLDAEVGELVKSKTRAELTNQISSKRMLVIPDLALLGSERVFWDEFSVEGNIGKGSFGEVSLGTVKATKAKIAVKIMSKKMPAEAEQRTDSRSGTFASGLREILRELWVLSVLDHPNIVASAGVCLEPLAVCMEYMALGDLRCFLERHGNHSQLLWHVRHSLLMDIASGMEYAHGQRPPLVHSDLKASCRSSIYFLC
jgi:Leucine-rich repeat (LRR) protein